MNGDAIRPLSLAFRDGALEDEYRRRNVERLRRKTVVTVTLVLVLYSAFGFLDPWIVPEALAFVWGTRVAVAALCAVLVLLTRTRAFPERHLLIIASLPVLGGLAILVT